MKLFQAISQYGDLDNLPALRKQKAGGLNIEDVVPVEDGFMMTIKKTYRISRTKKSWIVEIKKGTDWEFVMHPPVAVRLFIESLK